MRIEYKIKFEKDGLTIVQDIEQNNGKAASTVKQQGNGLPATQQEVASATAGNPLTRVPTDGGAGPILDTGGGPILDTGGGPILDTGGGPILDTGGGPILDTGGVPVASGSSPIFILGPIIFTNGASPELGKPVGPSGADTAPKALGKAAGE